MSTEELKFTNKFTQGRLLTFQTLADLVEAFYRAVNNDSEAAFVQIKKLFKPTKNAFVVGWDLENLKKKQIDNSTLMSVDIASSLTVSQEKEEKVMKVSPDTFDRLLNSVNLAAQNLCAIFDFQVIAEMRVLENECNVVFDWK